MKKQQGVAAIILVLILIPLFGSVFFALESTRYIQKKTRLADATEAAAIAVTDENPKGLNIEKSESSQKEKLKSYETKSGLANLYINRYIRNINNDTIIITPTLYINNNDKKLEENPSYYQYNVDVTTTHNSWFYNKIIPSFKEQQNITENSLARNYPKLIGDQPIDLVFVADFSGSMFEPINKSLIISYDDILSRKYNCNAIYDGEIYYDHDEYYYTYTCNGEYLLPINDPSIKIRMTKENSKIGVLKNSIDLISKKILKDTSNEISFVAFNNRTYKKENGNFYELKNYVYNYKYTVKNIFNPSLSQKKIIDWSSFYNINLTNNLSHLINEIENMRPGGGTAAYQGLIEGARILDKKDKKDKRKKIIILISDGLENEPRILKNLVKYGLCEKIREHFSSSNNKMFMGMVGIGYKASDNDVFHQCFDENIYNSEHQLISESNIIDVDDLSTLTDKIKELIRKGQQTDGISKLSDGQN